MGYKYVPLNGSGSNDETHPISCASGVIRGGSSSNTNELGLSMTSIQYGAANENTIYSRDSPLSAQLKDNVDNHTFHKTNDFQIPLEHGGHVDISGIIGKSGNITSYPGATLDANGLMFYMSLYYHADSKGKTDAGAIVNEGKWLISGLGVLVWMFKEGSGLVSTTPLNSYALAFDPCTCLGNEHDRNLMNAAQIWSTDLWMYNDGSSCNFTTGDTRFYVRRYSGYDYFVLPYWKLSMVSNGEWTQEKYGLAAAEHFATNYGRYGGSNALVVDKSILSNNSYKQYLSHGVESSSSFLGANVSGLNLSLSTNNKSFLNSIRFFNFTKTIRPESSDNSQFTIVPLFNGSSLNVNYTQAPIVVPAKGYKDGTKSVYVYNGGWKKAKCISVYNNGWHYVNSAQVYNGGWKLSYAQPLTINA